MHQSWTGHCAIVPWHMRPPSTKRRRPLRKNEKWQPEHLLRPTVNSLVAAALNKCAINSYERNSELYAEISYLNPINFHKLTGTDSFSMRCLASLADFEEL